MIYIYIFYDKAPEGKAINSLTSISPVSVLKNLPCTPSPSVPGTNIADVHSSLATPLTPPAPHLSPTIESVPGIQPPSKRIKWNKTGYAEEEEISPETDKMIEEELCSFLSIVEAAEAKEHSVSTPTLQLDDTISTILPIDLNASRDHLEGLESKGFSTPALFSTQEIRGEGVEKGQSAFIPNFHMDHTISPISPLDMNRSARKAAFSTPKLPDKSSIIQTHGIEFEAPEVLPSADFKTPKAMQLFTSLDGPCDSPSKKLIRPVFNVPMSEIPRWRPDRPPKTVFTPIPSAAMSTRLFKKVSFGHFRPKSDRISNDTGYVSLPISKEARNIEVPLENASENNQSTMPHPGLEYRQVKEMVEEFEPHEVLREASPPSEVEFELLREGWDQLATFIYCYNNLRKFGKPLCSVEDFFVYGLAEV